MKKTIVCHVVSGLKAGGVESVIYNYCSKMDPKKYEWHLLYQHEPSQKNVEEFKKINFILKRIPSKIKHPFKNYYETKKYFIENNIEIVHCHMTLMNIIPLIAAKKAGIKKRICHSHNSDVRKKNFLIKIIEYIIKKICIKSATNLVSCGEDAGKYMYGKEKFEILYNAMNLEKYRFDKNIRKQLRKKYNIEDNEIVIGHIGRFTEQKNHVFLVECAKQVIEKNNLFKFVLIGDGELKQEIENLCKDNNSIIFTGIVPNTNEYYNMFDLFVLPSLWEGLPVVSVEAQCNGLKSLFSKNIDCNSIINKTNCKMLELVQNEWITEILATNNKYDRTIDNAIFEIKHLDIDCEYNKLENIYK